MKGNFKLDAFCAFRKCHVFEMILCLMNSKEKIMGVKKNGKR
jgi:hypothetical protein